MTPWVRKKNSFAKGGKYMAQIKEEEFGDKDEFYSYFRELILVDVKIIVNQTKIS